MFRVPDTHVYTHDIQAYTQCLISQFKHPWQEYCLLLETAIKKVTSDTWFTDQELTFKLCMLLSSKKT